LFLSFLSNHLETKRWQTVSNLLNFKLNYDPVEFLAGKARCGTQIHFENLIIGTSIS